MSTFKKIKPRDVYVSSHLAKKRWQIPQTSFEALGITTGSFSSGSDNYWDSLRHLYYSNFEQGEFELGSYENYLQSTLSQFSSRSLADDITVVSISRNLFGVGIQPGTFSLQSGSFTIQDNSEGEVFTGSLKVGDLIYAHGILILSGSSPIDFTHTTASFNARQPIHTLNVHCRVLDSEMTYTSNPSAMVPELYIWILQDGNWNDQGQWVDAASWIDKGLITKSGGAYITSLTGSAFQPYVTTIGLYNDSNELIAVGKLGRPTPKSQNTDMTFVIRLDM